MSSSPTEWRKGGSACCNVSTSLRPSADFGFAGPPYRFIPLWAPCTSRTNSSAPNILQVRGVRLWGGRT